MHRDEIISVKQQTKTKLFPQISVYSFKVKVKLPSYHEAGVWAVDVISRSSEGGAATITSQYVLTGSLKVKGPAIEGVVVRVTKDCTYTWLCRWTEAKRNKDGVNVEKNDQKKSK